MAYVSDEVLRKRLVTREIRTPLVPHTTRKCFESYMAFLTSLTNESDSENVYENAYERLMEKLAEFEFSICQNNDASQRCLREIEQYEALSSDLEQEIKQAQQNIGQLRQDLEDERTNRMHKAEFEQTAAAINKYPSSQKLREMQNAQQERLDAALAEKMKLDQLLEQRKNQFNLLMCALHDVKQLLNNPLTDESELLGSGGEGDGVAVEEDDDAVEADKPMMTETPSSSP